MTSLSVVSIISQWPIWIVFHLLRWNILSKQKEEKPLISLYASATQRPRTSLEALLQSWNLNHLSWNEKALVGRSFELYHGNVSSIHKNIKKDRGTKNEFHWRIFCKTLIRQHSCTTHCVQTVPVLAAILQKILWNSIISYLYLFYVFMNTWRHSRIKLRIFKRKGVYVRRYNIPPIISVIKLQFTHQNLFQSS